MKKVVVSAPGKLHLSGEHAVVHGKPAMLSSTSSRLYVTLEHKQTSGPDRIHALRQKDAFIGEICKTLETRLSTAIPADLAITIASDIPVGAGMGSSAALSVALIGALMTFLDLPWDPQKINELAYQAEKFMHVNASGSDPAVVTHGGILWYRKELDYLKTFWLLPFKFPKSFAPFILVNTGRAETTGELVSRVGRLKSTDESSFTLLLSEVEAVTKRMAAAIHDENEQDFRASIQENQRLLENMGIVSESTKLFIRAVEDAGGVAKISGAGGVKKGSGVVIAIHDSPKALAAVCDTFSHKTFQVMLGGEGIRKEQIIA